MIVLWLCMTSSDDDNSTLKPPPQAQGAFRPQELHSGTKNLWRSFDLDLELVERSLCFISLASITLTSCFITFIRTVFIKTAFAYISHNKYICLNWLLKYPVRKVPGTLGESAYCCLMIYCCTNCSFTLEKTKLELQLASFANVKCISLLDTRCPTKECLNLKMMARLYLIP